MTRLLTRRTDVAEGKTLIRVMVASAFLSLTLLPLQGQQAFSLPYHFQFKYDLAPLLARHGCAAADCHGGATGRGGFKLSLFASDDRADYRAITQDLDGRRVDLVTPENSLLLKKPSRQINHEGGKVFGKEDDAYRHLRQWIREGAPYSRGQPRQLESLVLSRPAAKQLKVTAAFRLQDGSTLEQDVTAFSLFSSTHEPTATVNEWGEIALAEPGLSWITATFAGHSDRLRILRPFPPKDAPLTRGNQEGNDGAPHPLDRAWKASLKGLSLAPAPPAPSRTLVRRLYLDLAGRIPSPEEVATFLAAPASHRLATTRDQLLQASTFAEAMAPRFWAWFELPHPREDAAPRQALHEELRQQLRQWLQQDLPMDTLVDLLLPSSPGPLVTRFEDPRDRAEYFGRSLLGLRLGCARCHNHPLDRWQQEQHLRFSAWFADPRPSPEAPSTMRPGKFFLPGENTAIPPALLPLSSGSHANQLHEGPPGEVLRSFLRETAQPHFRRNAANRVFAWLIGRPLVAPADDHRLTNPALHEEVLAALVDGPWKSLRELIRFLTETELYQVSSDPAPETELSTAPDLDYLARREAVPLTPDQRIASMEQALGIPLGVGAEPSSPLARQLSRLNDARWQDALRQPGNSLEALMLFESHPERRLSQLFELILSRPPNQQERDAFITAAEELDSLRDLAFALFASREFGSIR